MLHVATNIASMFGGLLSISVATHINIWRCLTKNSVKALTFHAMMERLRPFVVELNLTGLMPHYEP
jgi:hypothetical protein